MASEKNGSDSGGRETTPGRTGRERKATPSGLGPITIATPIPARPDEQPAESTKPRSTPPPPPPRQRSDEQPSTSLVLLPGVTQMRPPRPRPLDQTAAEATGDIIGLPGIRRQHLPGAQDPTREVDLTKDAIAISSEQPEAASDPHIGEEEPTLVRTPADGLIDVAFPEADKSEEPRNASGAQPRPATQADRDAADLIGAAVRAYQHVEFAKEELAKAETRLAEAHNKTAHAAAIEDAAQQREAEADARIQTAAERLQKAYRQDAEAEAILQRIAASNAEEAAATEAKARADREILALVTAQTRLTEAKQDLAAQEEHMLKNRQALEKSQNDAVAISDNVKRLLAEAEENAKRLAELRKQTKQTARTELVFHILNRKTREVIKTLSFVDKSEIRVGTSESSDIKLLHGRKFVATMSVDKTGNVVVKAKGSDALWINGKTDHEAVLAPGMTFAQQHDSSQVIKLADVRRTSPVDTRDTYVPQRSNFHWKVAGWTLFALAVLGVVAGAIFSVSDKRVAFPFQTSTTATIAKEPAQPQAVQAPKSDVLPKRVRVPVRGNEELVRKYSGQDPTHFLIKLDGTPVTDSFAPSIHVPSKEGEAAFAPYTTECLPVFDLTADERVEFDYTPYNQ